MRAKSVPGLIEYDERGARLNSCHSGKKASLPSRILVGCDGRYRRTSSNRLWPRQSAERKHQRRVRHDGVCRRNRTSARSCRIDQDAAHPRMRWIGFVAPVPEQHVSRGSQERFGNVDDADIHTGCNLFSSPFTPLIAGCDRKTRSAARVTFLSFNKASRAISRLRSNRLRFMSGRIEAARGRAAKLIRWIAPIARSDRSRFSDS